MKQKLLAVCLGICMVLGCSVTASAWDTAPDLENCAPWKREALEWAARSEIFAGDEQGRLLPDKPMTRAMFVTVLYRMAGVDEPVRGPVFGDVRVGSYYEAAAQWAGAMGIVQGVETDHLLNDFQPEFPVTREQAVVMLYRWMQVQQMDTSPFDTLYGFSDRKKVSSWSREAMEWAVGARIISGTKAPLEDAPGTLSPRGGVTRAEAAVMLQRLDQELQFQALPLPDPLEGEEGFGRFSCGGGERTLQELMEESTLAVVGTVTGTSDYYVGRNGKEFTLYRDFELAPLSVLRGEAEGPIFVRAEGGTYGNWTIQVASEARLGIGTEYLLFLVPASRDGAYRVLGYLGAYEKTGIGTYRNERGGEIGLDSFRKEIAVFNRDEPVW